MSTGARGDEWIGVEDVAAEMRYTVRQAWEYLRSIGLGSANARSMKLARFTRADFEEARERSKKPLSPRAKAGAIPEGIREKSTGGRPIGPADPVAVAAAKAARLRRS